MEKTIKANEVVINAECMRDLCGSFYNLRSRHRNTMLVYLIPSATKRAIECNPRWFGIHGIEATHKSVMEVYHETLTEGFEALLEDERTSNCVKAWMNGEKDISEFTFEEVAYICDVYYIDTVAAAVEGVAIDMIREFDPHLLHN
jgi:hypothetical protein